MCFSASGCPYENAEVVSRHAGYAYSGPAAAVAYATLDLSQTKRIFLLGPSHAYSLSGAALTGHAKYSTPLGDLEIDKATIAELQATGKFETMSSSVDETEHSLEMHLPYIHRVASRQCGSRGTKDLPTLVPIMVGNTTESREKAYGDILAPYLSDPSSAFIVSSDFCHWGLRFDYTYYAPEDGCAGYHLKRSDKDPTNPRICDSIRKIDEMAMEAIESGKHAEFLGNLKSTENTVCGRHPIGVMMAALETAQKQGSLGESCKPSAKGAFKFIRYDRSSEVEEIQDSSVSYASAYGLL